MFSAYSFIDLLSASGGTIKGISFIFTPFAEMFSQLSFDLAVIGLLYKARIICEDDNKECTEQHTARIKVSTCQFMRLWWRLNNLNPWNLLGGALCCFGS